MIPNHSPWIKQLKRTRPVVLLDEIITEARLQTPMYRFIGYAGLSSLKQVLLHLKNNHCRVQGGLQAESMLIAEEWECRKDTPQEFKDLYQTVAHEDLLDLLETKNPDYIASLSFQKG